LFSLIHFQKLVLNKTQTLKYDSAAYTGNHGNYMKCITFLWPSVVAAQALHGGGCYWLYKNYPHTQHSVMSTILFKFRR
jgi:hypothetical protein